MPHPRQRAEPLADAHGGSLGGCASRTSGTVPAQQTGVTYSFDLSGLVLWRRARVELIGSTSHSSCLLHHEHLGIFACSFRVWIAGIGDDFLLSMLAVPRVDHVIVARTRTRYLWACGHAGAMVTKSAVSDTDTLNRRSNCSSVIGFWL